MKHLAFIITFLTALASASVVQAQAPAQPGVLYGVDGSASSNVYTIDPSTGASTLIGQSGERVWIIATAPDGRIFGAQLSPAPVLWRIDGVTGAATIVDTMNVSPNEGDLTFDNNGVLYLSSLGGNLYTVDTATAQATLVGNTGLGAFPVQLRSIAHDPVTDLLYSAVSDEFFDYYALLYTIDKSTAASTLVDTMFSSLFQIPVSGLRLAFSGPALVGRVQNKLIAVDKATADTTIIASGLPSNVISLASVFPDPSPAIQTVSDIGNDQGRQVRVEWSNSSLDAPGGTITEYGIWRRVDANLFASSRENLPEPPPARASLAAAWDFIGTVPARGDSLYSVVVPTLCDSTDQGICWSVFFVSAMTADPWTYWDSAPDSGFSIDNLAPSAPLNLQLVTTDLSWDEAPEEDFDYFAIYGSASGSFPGATLIGYSTTPDFDVAGEPYAWYHVTATDFAGNEGDDAALANTATDVESDTSTPTVLSLRAPRPNPFRAQTSIAFDMPAAARASIAVYDVSGRLVSKLVDGEVSAGRHAITWNGRDSSGQPTSPGVYFIRMNTGGRDLTQRIVRMR